MGCDSVMAQVSTYNQNDADTICAALAEGHSLLSICEAMGLAFATAMEWEARNPIHADNAARARELGCRAMAEQILSISDTPHLGVVRTIKPDGSIEERHEDMTQHRRLQVDSRKWLLSKWASKLYGDRLDLAATVTVKRDAAEMTDNELLSIALSKGTNADS